MLTAEKNQPNSVAPVDEGFDSLKLTAGSPFFKDVFELTFCPLFPWDMDIPGGYLTAHHYAPAKVIPEPLRLESLSRKIQPKHTPEN